TQPAGALETGVVGLTTLQGSVNEQGRFLCRQPILPWLITPHPPCPPPARTLGDNDRNRPPPMTIALLLALLGSLGLMALIVKRLERA
ncbi:MAG: hypothetical protein ACK6BC_15915, partial [Cyanobacteriota bacterium]